MEGLLFVAPFLLAAGSALVFGSTMRPVHSFVSRIVLAAALIFPFWLGLDASHCFDDPAVQQGFATWVLLAMVAVPAAWLTGLAIGSLWRRTNRSRTAMTVAR